MTESYFVWFMGENDNVTVINKLPQSAEVNAELRNFAEKLRGSKERICDDSACVSVTDENLVTPSCRHDSANPNTNKDVDINSSKTQYPGPRSFPAAKSSVFSHNQMSKVTTARQQQTRPRLTTYLKDWLQLKERRNMEYLDKYLRTHPVVSEYKREHIRKFGKPTFMNNAQAYLRRKEFVVNHSRVD